MPEGPHWEVAAAVTESLRRREKRNLLAVGVFGSVARGEVRRFSDLDLLVVVRKKNTRLRPAMLRGVLVTYHHLTAEEAREEVTGLLRRLKLRAARPRARQFNESARRDLLETYEDLGKLRNAIADGDKEEAREMALWFTGAAAGSLLDLERHVTRTGRRMFIEARRYGSVGRAIWGLRYEELSLARTSALAERVWRGLLARARDRWLRIPGLIDG